MDTQQFVEALAMSCRDAAVIGCVESWRRPPGRKPSAELMALSAWFNSLSDSDQSMVIRALKDVADATLFGVFCVLDGVRSVEAVDDKSEFRLTATRAGVTKVICPSNEHLHDIYKTEP